jgi:hypothetical protein
MTWFEALTGFAETTPDEVRGQLELDGETLTSLVNGRVMTCGRLETPSLAELRERVRSDDDGGDGSAALSVQEVVADVQSLHADPQNASALFQVASQFNLLEMVSPRVTPEDGVGLYDGDHTQGPACAVAAGAGTIYRNYFALVDGQTGQSAEHQIDCLADIGQALGNADGRLWQMQNGYALAARDGLIEIAQRLREATDQQRDALRARLRIGLQWDTEVTLQGAGQAGTGQSGHRQGRPGHLVSQAYCSALPVAYSSHPPDLWGPFARLVLEGAYEATLCAAILNGRRTGNHRVFLTLLGGGAFGNQSDWITDALRVALHRYWGWQIDVAIVSHGGSNARTRQIVAEFL